MKQEKLKPKLDLKKIKQVNDNCKNTIKTQNGKGTKNNAKTGFHKTTLNENKPKLDATKVTIENKSKLKNSNAKNSKLLLRLNLPPNTETVYINPNMSSKHYILCPVCHKLLISPDIRSLKQHYVIHFKTLILKEIGDGITKCSECDLSLPRDILKALHFGIKHGMLDKFIKNEGFNIQNLDENPPIKNDNAVTSKAVLQGTEKATDKPLTSNDTLSQIIKSNNLTINLIKDEVPASNTTSEASRSSVIKSIAEAKLNVQNSPIAEAKLNVQNSPNNVAENTAENTTDGCKQNEIEEIIVEKIRKTPTKKVRLLILLIQ